MVGKRLHIGLVDILRVSCKKITSFGKDRSFKSKVIYQVFAIVSQNVRSIRRELVPKKCICKLKHQSQNNHVKDFTEKESSEVSSWVISNSLEVFHILKTNKFEIRYLCNLSILFVLCSMHCFTSAVKSWTFSLFAITKEDLPWLPKLSTIPASKTFQIWRGIAKQMAL